MNSAAEPDTTCSTMSPADVVAKERAVRVERNRAAIDSYNTRIELDGAFSDDLRVF